MAIKPLKPLKRHSKPLENWQIEYLNTGKDPKRATLEEWYMCHTNHGAEEWKEHQDWILKDFIRRYPGKRPWAWWVYDAPRWQRKYNAWFDGASPEPRLCVGGIGTPDYEVLSIVPSFSFGVPRSYISKWQSNYYNGRARDKHGDLIPCKHKEGDFSGVAIDFDDPPLFEAQASYLKRHGLLSKAEEKRLKPADFEPESCLKYMKTYD